MVWFIDFEAQRLLQQYRNETDQNLKHVKDLLACHGDVICSRWKKYSQEKTTDMLAEASSSELDSWNENQNALIRWLDLDSLSQDFTKLLAVTARENRVRTTFVGAFRHSLKLTRLLFQQR